MTLIGRWSLIVGIILAILTGFTDIASAAYILGILGLIVGFLNIQEKESTPFLVAVIALIVIGLSGLQIGRLTGAVVLILNNFIVFVGAAGLVVALKQVLAVVKPAISE